MKIPGGAAAEPKPREEGLQHQGLEEQIHWPQGLLGSVARNWRGGGVGVEGGLGFRASVFFFRWGGVVGVLLVSPA